jgi:hypothetical protein
LILHTFYAGLCPSNRKELDNGSEGAFSEYCLHKARDLLESIHLEKETYDCIKDIEMENSVDYQCIKYFLNTGRVGDLLGSYKHDPNMIANMVRKYTEFLQVP